MAGPAAGGEPQRGGQARRPPRLEHAIIIPEPIGRKPVWRARGRRGGCGGGRRDPRGGAAPLRGGCGGAVSPPRAAVRDACRTWANMLRAFHVGKTRTSQAEGRIRHDLFEEELY